MNFLFSSGLVLKLIKYLFLLLLGEPHSVVNATTDPFKTLFVARIVSYLFFLT